MPWLLEIVQSRITMPVSSSLAWLGSKSMPAAGGVPPVSRRMHRSMRRLRAEMTLMPWRYWRSQTRSRSTMSWHGPFFPVTPTYTPSPPDSSRVSPSTTTLLQLRRFMLIRHSAFA